MPLSRIRFQVAGAAQYARSFETYGREAEDLSTPFGDIAEIIRQSVGAQFQTEGAHGGARWQPLDPAYERWKQQNAPFESQPILVFSTAMRSAALSRDAFSITPRRLVYEVDSDYAIHHQEGRGHMPKREIVALTGSERRDFDHVFVSWLNSLRRGVIGRAA